MKELLAIFLPNRTVAKSTATLLVCVQVAALLTLWVFSPFVFLPTQAETLSAFVGLWDAGIGCELITSFTLNLQAIAVAALVSLCLAYLTVLPFFRPIVTLLSKLRFLSLVGLTFFFTLMAANGHQLKVELLAFSISVFFITSMMDVLDSIPRVQFDLARTLQMGEWGVVWEVVVLGQFDKVFDVLRSNAAIGFMMLTMIEGMARSDGGIGTVLLNQNKHFHLSAVLAIQLMILCVGLCQDYGIGVLRNIICPYARLTTERK
jgi:NitT/TauT family transport system permease protein